MKATRTQEQSEENSREEKTDVMETETGFSFPYFCEEAISLLLMAYLFIVFCMYPFYMQNGYMEIGKVKYDFYKAITIGAFVLLVPLACLCTAFRIKRKEITGKNWLKKISLTDWMVFFYGASVILSYLCSEYKEKALWGEKGWYMGLVTQLLFVLSYFLVSRFWEYEGKLLLAFMAAAAVVFGLGILNRFSVFPIEVEGANSSFLSTLGNINWYCGYWSVLFPLGFMLYWVAEKSWLRLLGLLFTAIGIATGVSQGSASAFLVFGGLYIFVFCLSFQSIKSMKRFWELVIVFCGVCQGLRLWRIWMPEAFDYYAGTLSDRMTMSRITLLGLGAALFIYMVLIFLEKRKKTDMKRYKVLRQIFLLGIVVIIGVYVFLLYMNSRIKGGIRFMGGLSALVFDSQWGSARGATWSAGIESFQNMSLFQRLVGAGPDCFYPYMKSIPDLAKRIAKQFDGARLTNAHNEWLTVLVNNGILGLISYAGIFISAVVRFLYYAERAVGEKRKYLYLFGMSVFAYTIHNVVSFQQILSTPFVFLLMGMGERLLREMEQSK